MGVSSGVRMTGPLVVFRAGFEAELTAQGFTDLGAAQQLRLMAHVSRWLADQGIEPGGLDVERIDAFLAERRRCYTARFSLTGLRPLLDYLRAAGVVPMPVVEIDPTPVGQLIESYRAYLVQERGMAARTVSAYVVVARRFLDAYVGPGGDVGLEGMVAADVTRFVVDECCRSSAPALVVTPLRCLLRFSFFEGLIDKELAWAVPGAAGWSGASLPKALPPEQVASLLASCDRHRAVGRRDFAMLMLMARLGLRAGEVGGLELEDIDWRNGDLVVRGKGRRDERLPLPGDVGDAMVAYLRRGRPTCACRKVFVRVRAPWRGLCQPSVTDVVYRACERAGLPLVGAHRLRHSAATEMLGRGATLAEVAQVLRHHDPLTTAGYAKVDRVALRTLAQPWPGVDR